MEEKKSFIYRKKVFFGSIFRKKNYFPLFRKK